MALTRGSSFRDDARLASAVVTCFGAKENQIACITREFPSLYLKRLLLKACDQKIVAGHPIVNPAALRHSRPACAPRP